MTYDAVPYLYFPVTTSSPRRVGAIARLYGVDAVSPRRARVLELGCGLGGNLLSLATAWPEAEFVGIDMSAVQIGTAELQRDALGLENLSLRACDILEFEAEGLFDYVICHGVYSWVPELVRDRILAICRQVLSPCGVAYISYNALPGWNVRRTVRDILLREVSATAPPQEQIGQARDVLARLAFETEGSQAAFAIVLESEVKALADYADTYLLHEHLAPVNDAFYLEDFVRAASAHGLAFAGDGQPGLLDITVKPGLGAHQWLDYAINNTFRETLLVRSETQEPLLKPDLQRILELTGCLRGGVPRPEGLPIDVWERLVRSPVGIPLAGFGPESVEDLMDLVVDAQLELGLEAVPASAEPGELPCASPLARLQILEGREQVTNLGHEDVTLEEGLDEVLLELTGRQTRDALLVRLRAEWPDYTEEQLSEALYRLTRMQLLQLS